MKTFGYIIWFTILVILLLAEGYESFFIFKAAKAHLALYKWFGMGFAGFLVLRVFVRKNMEWFETFSHELTHTVVGLMFFQRIYSFNAGEGEGYIERSSSGLGHVFISLAPYCLPIYTYLFLLIRFFIVPEYIWIFDMLIGATFAFHCFCFMTQSRNYQTDINQFPLTFSYLYIFTFILFNVCILLFSFFKGQNVFTAFMYMGENIWNNIVICIKWLGKGLS